MTEVLKSSNAKPAVTIRTLPAMRAATFGYCGPASEVSNAFAKLEAFVQGAGIGPAGPLLCSYSQLIEPSVQPIAADRVQLELLLMVPVTRLIEGHGQPFRMRRFSSQRAACFTWRGPLSAAFRAQHQEIFCWLEQEGLPYQGSRHQHAFLARDGDIWTVEIRVPLLPFADLASGTVHSQ
ncbi:MAG: hypothetical protein CMP23_14265 [Rickettsiales bacterium]|nr:hypothetical protein [Rickettsiales bacterium]